jgi:anti-sigma regulatory factor (Ser/Thr protein kinase)
MPRIRIPADVRRLADVRAVVRDAARDAGAEPGIVDDLVQAVDEAATNAIVHGYAGQPGWVEVTLTVTGKDIAVTVEDEAPGFDPTALPDPDMRPGARPGPGGMGSPHAAGDRRP